MIDRRRRPPGLMLAACLVTLLSARPAAADWLFAPFLGLTFKGSTTLLDWEFATDNQHRTYGAAVTLVGDGILGGEAYFAYVPGFFDHGDLQIVTRSRTYALMGNLVLTTPRRWNEYGLRPFVSGGFGLMHASETDVYDIFPFNENLFGMNIGGGATGFVTDRVGLRFDLRLLKSLARAQNSEGLLVPGRDSANAFGAPALRYWTGSIGLVLRY